MKGGGSGTSAAISGCGSGFIGRLPGLPRSTFSGNGTGGLGMAQPPRAFRGKFARFGAGKRGVPKNNFSGQIARTAAAKLTAPPALGNRSHHVWHPPPAPFERATKSVFGSRTQETRQSVEGADTKPILLGEDVAAYRLDSQGNSGGLFCLSLNSSRRVTLDRSEGANAS